MRTTDQSRWLLSFADLILLLLAFFVLLHAGRVNPDAVVVSISDAFAPDAHAAAVERRVLTGDIFMPGEAVLRPAARARFQRLARGWARQGGAVSITSTGRDADTARFDSWELAAARAAALGRAIREAGVEADAIEIVIPSSRGRAGRGRQTLLVRYHPG